MIMINVLLESSQALKIYQDGYHGGDKFFYNILSACDEDLKAYLRVIENNLLKITALTSHLCLTETCFNTYIYIYIYIYIHPHVVYFQFFAF